jgi:hypothetical protein
VLKNSFRRAGIVHPWKASRLEHLGKEGAVIYWDLVFAIVVAIILSVVLVNLIGWRHPSQEKAGWPSGLFVFFVVTLVALAGGAWLAPREPGPWYEHWWPVLAAGVAVGLLLLAMVPPAPRRLPPRKTEDAEVIVDEMRTVHKRALFGVFFWILVAALVVIVVLGYATYSG